MKGVGERGVVWFGWSGVCGTEIIVECAGAAPIEGSVESMLQERPSGLHALLSGLSFKTKPMQPTKRSASMDEGHASGSVLGSIRRMISKGRAESVEEGFKPIGSGPCEAFADWPIPRYPDNYEWDE